MCVRVCVCIFVFVLQTSSKPASLKTVLAIADYHGRYSDELSFRSGDRLNVTVESEGSKIKGLGWVSIAMRIYI